LGQFSATASNYGYLLSDVQAGDTLITDVAHAQGAASTTILLPQGFRRPLGYLLVAGHADRIGVVDSCLILPQAASRPTLIVTTRAADAAAQLLQTLPNVSFIRAISLRGAEPFRVYRLDGNTPAALPGEHHLGGVPFGLGASTDDMRLDAMSVAAAGLLRLRWT